MIRVEHYDLSAFESVTLTPAEVEAVKGAFEDAEEKLKDDLKECARLQALSEKAAMSMPPDVD